MMRRTSTTFATALGVLLAVSACTSPVEPVAAPEHVVAAADPVPAPSAETSDPMTAAFDLRALPRPALDSTIPAPQTDATLDDAHAVGRSVFDEDGVSAIAHPRATLTPAYAKPDDSEAPILALEATTLEQPAAWLVTAATGDWVQVLVPLGRGALPSDDPGAVNGRAVWVRGTGVQLAATRASVVVDVSERTATVTGADGEATDVTVGVGRDGTDTPRGLGSLAGFGHNPDGLDIAVTSMQSTRLDGYDGASFAAFALHPDPEHGAALGKARSNGCIRMDASDYAELVDPALPLGTPIWVVD